MKKAILLPLFVLCFGVEALGASQLIWEGKFGRIAANQWKHSDYENILQLDQFHYVSTRVIGFTWKDLNGHCYYLYQPDIYVKSDELSETYTKLNETKSPNDFIRHADKASSPVAVGKWFYEVPAGLNIAQIQLRMIRKSIATGDYGKCYFQIWAVDPVFGHYNP